MGMKGGGVEVWNSYVLLIVCFAFVFVFNVLYVGVKKRGWFSS